MNIKELGPKEWLNHIRLKYGFYHSSPFKLNKKWLDELVSRIPESNRENAREIWEQRDGKPINEMHEENMSVYLAELEHVIMDAEKEIYNSTYFGILPTYRFNGCAGKTPKGDSIVILHELLGYTINLWSYWNISFYVEGNVSLLKDEKKKLKLLEYISNIWNGSPMPDTMPDFHPKKQQSWQISQMLTFCSIIFILGHELGHLIKGHKSYSDNIDSNYNMEFEADKIGLSFVIRYIYFLSSYPGVKPFTGIAFSSPLFVLSIISLFGNKSTETHPSATLRSEKIIDQFSLVLKEEKKKYPDIELNYNEEDLKKYLRDYSNEQLDIFSHLRSILNKLNINYRTSNQDWLNDMSDVRWN